MAKNAVNYTGLIPEVGDSFESATTNTTGSLEGIDTRLGELNINKADLISGKIPIDQIPLSMNDFQEGYYKTLDNLMYKDSGYTILLDKLTDVLYLDLNTKNQYRYTGTIYEYVGTGAEATPSSNGLMSAFDKKKLDKKPYTFNTVADLQTATWLVEGDTIQLLGHYTKNDGFGGYFEVKIKDSNIAVDNYNYILYSYNGNLALKLVKDENQLNKCNIDYLSRFHRKIRNGENIKIGFLGDSNMMRSSSIVQTSFVSALDEVYLGSVSRNDRAYPGDNAQAGYNRYTNYHDSDISIICYGTNDASDQYGFPYSTRFQDYEYWIEKMVARELDWGKAVFLSTPINVRNDKRWETSTNNFVTDPYPTVDRFDSIILGNICRKISEKYGIVFIDSRELMSNYLDEIFADSNGKSLATATVPFGDVVHLTDEGLTAWGKRLIAPVLSTTFFTKCKVQEGTAFATRKGEDPFITTSNVFDSTKRIRYYDQAFGVGDSAVGNRALELHGESITYFFYCEEDMVVYPNMYVFGGSTASVVLDCNAILPQPTLSENKTTNTKYGYNGASFFTLNGNCINVTKGENDSSPIVGVPMYEKGIRIPSKGWHSLTISVPSGQYVSVSGLRFKNNMFSRLVEKIKKNRTWGTYTTERISGGSYTNNTGKEIVMSINVTLMNGQSANISVDGIFVSQAYNGDLSNAITVNLRAEIPDGSTYIFSKATTAIIERWLELR